MLRITAIFLVSIIAVANLQSYKKNFGSSGILKAFNRHRNSNILNSHRTNTDYRPSLPSYEEHNPNPTYEYTHHDHGDGYEEPSDDDHLSLSKLYHLFLIKSSVANARHRFDAADEYIDDEFPDIHTYLEELKTSAVDALGGFIPICSGVDLSHNDNTLENAKIVGHKCYTLHYARALDFSKARNACKRRGGKSAAPDLSPGSTWGSDIYSAFMSDIDAIDVEIWLGGQSDSTQVVLTRSGFKIPNDHSRYRSNNLGLDEHEPEVDNNEGLTLTNLDLTEDNWYLSTEDAGNDIAYLCEYHLSYVPMQ